MSLWVTQLRKGLVELCVLAGLRDGEAYGYQIVERLRQLGRLGGAEGTSYPRAARLARDAVRACGSPPWRAGPPRRYYRLTDAGRQRFREMDRHWQTLQGSVNQLLEGGRA